MEAQPGAFRLTRALEVPHGALVAKPVVLETQAGAWRLKQEHWRLNMELLRLNLESWRLSLEFLWLNLEP
jgi:hypothetical protein